MTAGCTEDGGVAVLTGRTAEPPGVVLAWDVQRTTYEITGAFNQFDVTIRAAGSTGFHLNRRGRLLLLGAGLAQVGDVRVEAVEERERCDLDPGDDHSHPGREAMSSSHEDDGQEDGGDAVRCCHGVHLLRVVTTSPDGSRMSQTLNTPSQATPGCAWAALPDRHRTPGTPRSQRTRASFQGAVSGAVRRLVSHGPRLRRDGKVDRAGRGPEITARLPR